MLARVVSAPNNIERTNLFNLLLCASALNERPLVQAWDPRLTVFLGGGGWRYVGQNH